MKAYGHEGSVGGGNCWRGMEEGEGGGEGEGEG